MSTADRHDEPLPARPPAPLPTLPPAEAWDEPAEAAAPPAKGLTPKLVWRAARRHWWQVLVLWGVGSAALMALAYTRVKRTFVATAVLEVSGTAPQVFGPGRGEDPGLYLETQVHLVTSPDVLSVALAKHPEVAALPRIRTAFNPEAELANGLGVSTVSGTTLIRISKASESPTEAVLVVDAVIDAYLEHANNWANEGGRKLIERLKVEQAKLRVQVDERRKALAELVDRFGTVNPVALNQRDKFSVDQYNKFVGELDNAMLTSLRLESQIAALEPLIEDPRPPTQADVDNMLADDPRAGPLLERYNQARLAYDRVSKVARRPDDPSVVEVQRYLKRLEGELARSRQRLESQVHRKAAEAAPGHEKVKALEALRLQLATSKATEEEIRRKLEKIRVESQAAGAQALAVEFARADLNRAVGMLEAIGTHINQLEWEGRGGDRVVRRTRTDVVPNASKRLTYMAAGPVVMLAAVLGLVTLVEARAARVADPDDVPSRARVEVLGVVPPLPSLRPARGLWGPRDPRHQLEEFVQSLDHLRVTLGAGRDGGRRCVLITSAIGGEGKTTLAAHLAGRCANAGLSTLLIDADLRNPSLSRLLKVPEGPGLADVLRGEVAAEAALVPIEAGGGFHLLPAGSPQTDPSRLLQGQRLARALGQFRAAFDVVIVDAPPVLLVPDALILGRWTDGAVLAVRYDTSRFPLLERANRRLAAVGVPVLGAVVNGVRSPESPYSRYAYAAHAAGPQAATTDDAASGPA